MVGIWIECDKGRCDVTRCRQSDPEVPLTIFIRGLSFGNCQIFFSESFFDPSKCRDCQFIFIKLTVFIFLLKCKVGDAMNV